MSSLKQSFACCILLSTLVVSLLTGAEAVHCPMNCKCSWILDSLEVDCSNSGLVYYPGFDTIPVEHLDLSGNNLVEFPTQYADIQSLIYLDLSNNDIEFLDANALIGFTKLRTLVLANNSFASWDSLNPPQAFLPAISLRRLSLSGNNLETFDDSHPKWVIRSESLIQLELNSCGITSAKGDHVNSALPNLEYLSLANNPLSDVGPLPSSSLRELHLNECKLARVNPYLLAGQPSLEILNLSRNFALQFTVSGSTPESISSDSLLALDLSFCNVDSLDLSGFPNLRTARLQGNMLRTVGNALFANNTMLESLDLSRNSLRLLESNAFAALKRLNKVDMSYNEIARLDQSIFAANDALVSINLSRNIIEKFTKISSNSLRDINLSWCEILAIDGNALTALSSIQRLDLSNNLIRAIPNAMSSETLQKLDLSNCRLSAIRNNTFREFPELASLRLNGNRFTNPFPTEFFKSNRYLDEIWVGDNPWICNCADANFMEFYDYLTAAPQKIRDKTNARCASPPDYYGKTWESACINVWIPNARTSAAERIWTTIMLSLLGIVVLFLVYKIFQKLKKKHTRRQNSLEERSNHDEMREIRRQNERMLRSEGAPNAPSTFETNLPSYEDALRMPKPVRPAKSMYDLIGQSVDLVDGEPDELNDRDLVLDNKHRFRSEAMLSNRDIERTAQMATPRRTGRVEYNPSSSRCFFTEDSRFPAAHYKSQNLKSAEKIGNFQSYENSPYTRRKTKIAEIPPFRRATMRADSVEFLTDPEYDAHSKPSSPFARRKKTITPSRTPQEPTYMNIGELAPAVEDYFCMAQKGIGHAHSSSSDGSGYQVLTKPDVVSLRDFSDDSDDDDADVHQRLNEQRRREREAK